MSLRGLTTLGVATATVGCAVGLALFGAWEAREFRPGLNLPAPLVGDGGESAPPPARAARRVVLVIVDGLRVDASRTMPALDAVRARGVDAVASSHYPTLSKPNYVSILAGVPPRLSGVRTNDYAKPVPLETALTLARAAGLRTRYVTDFAYGGGDLFAPDLDDAAAVPWRDLFERVLAVALAREEELVVVHFGQVDNAGHAEGADSDEYRAAVAETDAILGRVLAGFDWERDALVIVADHGHVDEGGHGGLEPEVVEVPLVLAGAGVSAGARVGGARLVDVAPTVCALLGLPAPRQAVGRTLTEALRVDAAAAVALAAADTARARRVEGLAGDAASRMTARAWVRRLARGASAGLFVAALFVAVRWLSRRGVIKLDRRVLLVAVPTFPATFYGLLAAFEPFMSPSMMPEQGDVLALLLRYGGTAAVANVMAIWLAVAWRAEPRERLAAATGVAMVGMLVALVPAGLAWVAISPPFAATVPGPTAMMLPPVTFAGVACYAASAAVALVAEWAVYAARASA